MLAKSRTSCELCLKEGIKCGRERPVCKNCAKHKGSCRYKVALQWGGRPYRDIRKHIKIPKDSMMVDGILTIKKLKVKKPKRPTVSGCKTEELVPAPRILPAVPLPTTINRITVSEELESLPAMVFVRSSPNYLGLLQFFIEKTTRLLVAFSDTSRDNDNPFRVIVPEMAMHSVTLMKIVVAFGAQHKHQLTNPTEADDGVSRMLVREAVWELVDNMDNMNKLNEQGRELTLASILMLAGYSIFFGVGRTKWSIHLSGAREILKSMIAPQCHERQGPVVVEYSGQPGARFFLQRLFSYITVMGLLSSAPLAYSDVLTIDFSTFQRNPNSTGHSGAFDNVEYYTGMESKMLEMLMRVGTLVMKCEKQGMLLSANGGTSLLTDAIELDYEITRYLHQSEKERDLLFCPGEVSEADELLRATNQLFGLSATLHLRRRVMQMPPSSPLVKEVVLQAADVLQSRIPFGSTTLCCITFCIFTCGCECVRGSDLEVLQPLYARGLDQIVRLGMSSTKQAMSVMEECWRTRNSWWEIYKQRGIDLSFGM